MEQPQVMTYQEREQLKRFASKGENLKETIHMIAHWMRQTAQISFSEYAFNQKILIFILIFFGFLSGCNNSKFDFENRVKGQLKDPDSAKFKNVDIREFCVFGEVNAKNSMGGYTGFTRFFVDDERVMVGEAENLEILKASHLCLKKQNSALSGK